MYFATVSLLSVYPRFASSFAMRRRLQSGLPRAVCWILDGLIEVWRFGTRCWSENPQSVLIFDRVLPNAPLRQWVLSLPFELRGLAATKPDVLTALGRIFAEEIARATNRLAKIAGAETGALSFPQRFGGSLNLHVHFHTLGVDGVFDKHGVGERLHETPPPEKSDIGDVARRVHDRARSSGFAGIATSTNGLPRTGNEPPAASPIDAFARLALGGGTFVARPFVPTPNGDEALDHKPRRFAASYNGFDVHCAVRVVAGDDDGRERLIRSCARPAFALERFEVLKDVRIAYRMKTPRRGSTHRVMTRWSFSRGWRSWRACARPPERRAGSARQPHSLQESSALFHTQHAPWWSWVHADWQEQPVPASGHGLGMQLQPLGPGKPGAESLKFRMISPAGQLAGQLGPPELLEPEVVAPELIEPVEPEAVEVEPVVVPEPLPPWPLVEPPQAPNSARKRQARMGRSQRVMSP
jgi:hypothetical protein